MDALTNNLRLVEVISASDALNNARTVLEEKLEEDPEERLEYEDPEWREGVRRHVLPVLDAEKTRLDGEYRRLREGR